MKTFFCLCVVGIFVNPCFGFAAGRPVWNEDQKNSIRTATVKKIAEILGRTGQTTLLIKILPQIENMGLEDLDQQLLAWSEDENQPSELRTIALHSIWGKNDLSILNRTFTLLERAIRSNEEQIAESAFMLVASATSTSAWAVEERDLLHQHFLDLTDPELIAAYLNRRNRLELFVNFEDIVPYFRYRDTSVREAAHLYLIDEVNQRQDRPDFYRNVIESARQAFVDENDRAVKLTILNAIRNPWRGQPIFNSWIPYIVDLKLKTSDLEIVTASERALFALRGGIEIRRDIGARAAVDMPEDHPFRQVFTNARVRLRGRFDGSWIQPICARLLGP